MPGTNLSSGTTSLAVYLPLGSTAVEFTAPETIQFLDAQLVLAADSKGGAANAYLATDNAGVPGTIPDAPKSNPQCCRVKIPFMSEGENSIEEMPFPIPPASFSFLVLSMRAQAEMYLGILPGAEGEEKPERNLLIARHTIDTMSMLLEKTKGNLTLEEQRLLENSLTELRFRFVQASDDESKTASQKA